MLISYLPLLVAVVGLLMFALATNPKLVEIGRTMMWTGLLVTLFALAGRTIKLF